MRFDVIIVGGGPAGLRCAELLAAGKVKVLVIEQKSVVGSKVCAGGITWRGLVQRLPEMLIEKKFCQQHITTPLQCAELSASTPIIATVNRVKLGHYMLQAARETGVEVLTAAKVMKITGSSVEFSMHNQTYTAFSDILVGADGSGSKVRRAIGLETSQVGVGINYQLNQEFAKMLWNFNSARFGSGYTWVFPHTEDISVGGYIASPDKSLAKFNQNIVQWSRSLGISLAKLRPQSEKINIDYRGWDFGSVFLIGDAAGLASPLTGEGIYPAFVSAEAVAEKILHGAVRTDTFSKLLIRHHQHRRILDLANRHKKISAILSELTVLLLRSGVLPFSTFEMAP